jgi:hypothetical protein
MNVTFNSRKSLAKAFVREAASKALNDAAFDLLSKSKKLAPLDEGDLRASGNTIPSTPQSLEAVVGFDTPYAVRMHEDLTYTPQEPGTGPKYLENPANQNAKKYRQHIQSELRKANDSR